ncbi:DNA primase [Dissulfurispira thermophila]|uniref:DNA primase n=1 Tax=Dissulfurispira thermophila TaxID=2715679 RepID=A0A7G1H1Y8_9BACT|nr:DNA primase [Dissulfurispira thermophila]BCB95747.1 DNA primase [Dissulfurispira thermophila]
MRDIVEDIKTRIDIIDLIAEHVELKRAGQNYKGLCPFHSEKTPSFMVNPSKQIFHCFGCHKGGDIFSFVMMVENMTFQEALSYLAQKAGIKLESKGHGSEIRSGIKENLFAIYKEALIFFRNNLKVSKHATSYLNKRGVDNETVEKFSLGYSKNEHDALFNHLKTKGFSFEYIKTSGLISSGDHGIYDFFRDRLIFPIFDLQGRPIAFGGRILSESKNAPKYINSPDSIIFKKGETSYGLNIAKNSIPQKGYSIIVEGYLDVISCHQYGLTNTIAPLGTALTSGQLKKLKRFSNKVLLIFDGDSAGISATKRSIELCYKEGIIVKILLLPQGEDPDTFLRKYGQEGFRKCMSHAISPVEFLLKVYDRSKLDAVRYMLQVIASCPDPLQRDETIRELSDRSKINELTLREELRHASRVKRQASRVDAFQKSGISSPENMEEKMLLSIALSFPDKVMLIANNIEPQIIEDPVIRGIFEKIKKWPSLEKLLTVCDKEEQKLITMLSINTEIDETDVEGIIENCLKTIAMKKLERQIRLAGEAGDVKLLNSLLFEKKSLLQKSKLFLNGGNLAKN